MMCPAHLEGAWCFPPTDFMLKVAFKHGVVKSYLTDGAGYRKTD